MGELVIRAGTVEDVDPVQKLANESKTLPFLGGFTMRDQLIGLYSRANATQPYNIVAVLDGELVGFSDSKAKGQHYHEYDLVAVRSDLRRQRIASAMYAYHSLRCALSGRMFARDQTIHFNTVMQDGFLPFHEFEHIVGLRNKVRNFSTLHWWILQFRPEVFDRMMEQSTTHHDVIWDLRDCEAFLPNMQLVVDLLTARGRLEDAQRVQNNRHYVLDVMGELVP